MPSYLQKGKSRLARPKHVPLEWVAVQTRVLKSKLPGSVQARPYYPDDLFYLQYCEDPLAALHYKSRALFSFLNIEPRGCIIDFCDDRDLGHRFSADAAGLYTRVSDKHGQETEIILVNSKYRSDPFAVGAVLAHEMMHLYLFRLGLRLEDTHQNELLTDLATINTGLSILILNGMSYSSDWWITIIVAAFGGIYWRSQELAFGYFKPHEYGQYASAYFAERGIPSRDFIGRLRPASRRFVPHPLSLRLVGSTALIRQLEKRRRRSNAIKGSIAASAVAALLAIGLVSGGKGSGLQKQIDASKERVQSLGATANSDITSLDDLNKQLAEFRSRNDVHDYNRLVEPHNLLLTRTRQEVSQYESARKACNALINEYNQEQ